MEMIKPIARLAEIKYPRPTTHSRRSINGNFALIFFTRRSGSSWAHREAPGLRPGLLRGGLWLGCTGPEVKKQRSPEGQGQPQAQQMHRASLLPPQAWASMSTGFV